MVGLHGRSRRVVALALGAALVSFLATSCGSGPTGPTQQFSSPAQIKAGRHSLAGALGPGAVSGTIRAPGGPYLYDSQGRVVFFHGVNAVYKYAPFELYPDPGKPWNFTAADARAIAGLGFDVVRLGIAWQALEPQGPGPNNPSICAPGTPEHPSMLRPSVTGPYLRRLSETVKLLGRYHIYVLLDMHQDAYSQLFRGEGAPSWAVCTGSLPIVALPGRWSHNYVNPALAVAESHFWLNDVVGNLQGQYDAAWAAVARHFADNPWVLGYDPYNEPYSTKQVYSGDNQPFAVDLECFYTGRDEPGLFRPSHSRIQCPADDPALGVIPTIERADPHHLVFFEPDNYSVRNGLPSLIGSMDFPRLVYNFHAYCGPRNPLTGDPTHLEVCEAQVLDNISRRQVERPDLSSLRQRGGPPWFMSEFGATHDGALLAQVTKIADSFGLGWSYWSWKYYSDPTGSSEEALAHPDGALYPTAATLSQAYPQAVAGVPVSVDYRVADRTLDFVYEPSASVTAPTVVFVPGWLYPRGYCAAVTGATIGSVPGDPHLQIDADSGVTSVSVRVHPGRCLRGA